MRAIVVTPRGEEDQLSQKPHPEVYRQALRVMLETPEISNRLNYITAALIFTVFGGWLAHASMKSRAFAVLVDLALCLACIALAGLGIGALIGAGFLPVTLLPILILAMIGVLAIFFLVLLASLILWAMGVGQERPHDISNRQVVVSSQEKTTPRRR